MQNAGFCPAGRADVDAVAHRSVSPQSVDNTESSFGAQSVDAGGGQGQGGDNAHDDNAHDEPFERMIETIRSR